MPRSAWARLGPRRARPPARCWVAAVRCRVLRFAVGPVCLAAGLILAGCSNTKDSAPPEAATALVEMQGSGSRESSAFVATEPFKYCWEQEGTVAHVSVGVRRLDPRRDQPPAEATDAETLSGCSVPLVVTPPGRFRLTVAAGDDISWRAWVRPIG